MTNNRPIGLFDSGIGGTTIWREIHALLPHESTIYLADTLNAPYGQKSKQEIVALSRKNTELLIELGCKIIVVACNTATTNAIAELRAMYDIPFIGLEPAVKPAAINSRTNRIGVLATKGTLTSELFNRTVESLQDVDIVEQIGHGLVQLIEEGKSDTPETEELLRSYLQPMISSNIDYLVLGCTHYPYLIPQIKNILPPDVQIIDSGEAVARRTQAVLRESVGLSESSSPSFRFFTNSDPTVLKDLLNHEHQVDYRSF